MSLYVKTADNEVIDFVSDEQTVAERMPRYDSAFEALVDLRGMNEDLGTVSNWGRMHFRENLGRVASIPPSVLAGILQIRPDFLLNKPEFYRWLDRHPGYQAIKRGSS